VFPLTKKEIENSLGSLPKEVVVGYGKDQVILRPRKVEDVNPPQIIGGPTASPLSEGEGYIKNEQSYVQESVINILSTGHPLTINGMQIRPGTPLEIEGAINELSWLREALVRGGRPGMPMCVGPGMAVTDVAVAASISEEKGIRINDLGVVAMLNELKVDSDRLNRALLFSNNGTNVIALVDPIIGGYSGPPEGTALVGLSACILAAFLYSSKVSIFHPCHMNLKLGQTSHPMTMWIENLVSQALSRNCNLMQASNIWTSARPGTKNIFYEIAANTIGATVSGAHVGPGIGGASGEKYIDGCSGLEARFMGEVAYATCGISIKEANSIIDRLLPLYLDELSNPPSGKDFHEVYYFDVVKPREFWLELYENVKNDLRKLGLEKL
jgi:methylamine--corrinoid protein Co-methyltransferase